MPQPPPPPSKRRTAARLAKLECFYDELKGNPRAILHCWDGARVTYDRISFLPQPG